MVHSEANLQLSDSLLSVLPLRDCLFSEFYPCTDCWISCKFENDLPSFSLMSDVKRLSRYRGSTSELARRFGIWTRSPKYLHDFWSVLLNRRDRPSCHLVGGGLCESSRRLDSVINRLVQEGYWP